MHFTFKNMKFFPILHAKILLSNELEICSGHTQIIVLLSVPERVLICFRLSFLAAAALWSPLNISLIIKRFQTIFGSYIP